MCSNKIMLSNPCQKLAYICALQLVSSLLDNAAEAKVKFSARQSAINSTQLKSSQYYLSVST